MAGVSPSDMIDLRRISANRLSLPLRIDIMNMLTHGTRCHDDHSIRFIGILLDDAEPNLE